MIKYILFKNQTEPVTYYYDSANSGHTHIQNRRQAKYKQVNENNGSSKHEKYCLTVKYIWKSYPSGQLIYNGQPK